MNLRQLRTLVSIAEQGSFTAAGNAVGLSHSAISLHVKALEEELGIALVDHVRAQHPAFPFRDGLGSGGAGPFFHLPELPTEVEGLVKRFGTRFS